MSIKSIDNTTWIALSACYPYDTEIDLQPQITQNSSGYVFISHPIFSKLKDTKAGKQTLFALTSSNNLSDIFSATKEIESTDLIIYTAFLTNNGNYISNINDTLYATASTISNTELFRVSKITGTEKYKIYYNSKVFTVDRNAPYNISLQDELEADTYRTQQFEIRLNGNTSQLHIMASFEAPWWTETSTPPRYLDRFLSYSPVNDQIRAIGLVTDDDYSANNNYTFTASVYIGEITLGFDGTNRFVSYFNDFDDISNNKNVNIETEYTNIKQNILIDSPYKTISEINNINKVGKVDINFTTLKNIMTPNYEYTTAPVLDDGTVLLSITGSEAVKRREYEKLFIGTNQDQGYERPYLEYNANTKSITFETDKCTFFHYPCSAPQIALSAAGIVESGAVAGGTPVRADRVKKKMANYAKNIWWGDSLKWQRGTWLCSWLSGSENIDIKPVWKDRWYNPGYIELSAALGEYVFVNNDPVIVDIDSELTFDPGVWYQYCHVGNVINKTLVDGLTGTAGTNLRLHLNNWAETTLDDSRFTNNGLLQPYSSDMIVNTFDGSVLKLNGTSQECLVPYSSTYKTDEVSYTVWVNVNNWNNTNGNHIVSNNFRGGWSLGWSNGFNSSIVPVYDKTYGHTLLHNLNGKILFDKLLPISGSNPNDITQNFADPVGVALDRNIYSWVIDNTYKKLYKLDFTGDIITQYIFNPSDELKDIVIDKNSDIYVLVNTDVYVFNTEAELINTIGTIISNPTKIDIDKDNTLRIFEADDVVIDKFNNAFIAASGNLYKESTVLLSAVDTSSVACDSDNNIWATINNTGYIKLSSDGAFILSGSNTSNQTAGTRSINLTNENNTDYVWIVQGSERKIYKYDTSANFKLDVVLTDGIDISQYLNHDKALMDFDMNGDPTGYDWHRKFKYIAQGEVPFIEATYELGSIQSVSSVSLTHSVSNLANKHWHHFASTYDSAEGIAKLYVDNIVRSEVSVTSGLSIYYEFENPLLIGANIGKVNDLNTELQNTQYYFNGLIDDLRIYDTPINNFDIKDIYLTKYDFKDINWNMPTGSQNYLEEVERFFKHKLPGMKSQYYNIRIVGLSVTSDSIKEIIEDTIRDTVTKISPIHTELLNIIWED